MRKENRGAAGSIGQEIRHGAVNAGTAEEKMRSFVSVIMLLLLLTTTVLGQTGDKVKEQKRYLYTWTDEQGNLHATDDLGNVPAKYLDQVQRTVQGPHGQQAGAPAPGPSVSAPEPEGGGDDGARKAEWMQRVSDAKARLAGAHKRYQQLQDERAELFRLWGSPALAPIANRERAAAIDQELPEVQKQIDAAQYELSVTIPEEARRAGIPPGWLRDAGL